MGLRSAHSDRSPERAGPTGLGRLEAIAELVPPGSRVADVGSGHGILARRLLASGRAQHCIATERSSDRIRAIRPFPPSHPLAGRLELRQGEGLAPILSGDRVNVVVLAGMGGGTIVRILGEPHALGLSVPGIVLQPQTETARVRRWLVAHGWAIAAERAVLERRRFYVALRAERRPDPMPAAHPALSIGDQLEAGPWLVRSGDARVERWWRGEQRRVDSILLEARGDGRRRALARQALIRRVLAALGRDREDPRAGRHRASAVEPERVDGCYHRRPP